MEYNVWTPQEVFELLDVIAEHKKKKAELILSYIKPETNELIKIRDQFAARNDVPEDMKSTMVSMFNKNIENNLLVISKAEEQIARIEGTH
jgi:hypothetical protein